MERLKKCPVCRGDAEVIQFPVSGDQLWQVNCRECGMGTELDDHRSVCIKQWNRRDREERLRYWLTLLGMLSPIGMILMLLLGILLGTFGRW